MYNYNTHTFRCGHSKVYDDKQYINEFKKYSFNHIGFSCHMPVDIKTIAFEHKRMHISQIDNYLKMKKHNKNIFIGFECEYYKENIHNLIYLKEKCDYLSLGQHFIKDVHNKGDINYPLIYAKTICEAINTGLFDYIAHPDYFLKYRDLTKKTEMNNYINNCDKALNIICTAAKKLNIPLEINLKYINNVKIMNDNHYPYPHPLLLKNIIKHKNKIIIGINTHSIRDIQKYKNNIKRVYDMIPNRLILQDYNIISYRKQNTNLDKIYKNFKNNIKTEQFYILEKFFKLNPYNITTDMILVYLKNKILNNNQLYNNYITKLKNEIIADNNSILDLTDKNFRIKRKKEYIKYAKKSKILYERFIQKIILQVSKINKDGKQLIDQLKTDYS